MKTQEKSDLVKKMYMASLPAFILSYLAGTVGMLVDGIVVGNFYNGNILSAYGMATPIVVLIASVASVFSAGLQTICSYCIGKNEIKKTNQILAMGNIAMLLTSVILMLAIAFGSGAIASVLGAKGANAFLLEDVKGYLLGMAFAAPPIFFYMTYSAILRLDNGQKIIMLSTVGMIVVNITGDILNAVLLRGGLLGMAMVTVGSYYCGVVILIFHFRKKERILYPFAEKPEWGAFLTVIGAGMPNVISRIASALRVIAINYILLGAVSSIAVGAASVQGTFHWMVGAIPSGMGLAVLTMTGVYAGEEDNQSLERMIRIAIKYAVLSMSIIAIVVLLIAPVIASFLTSASETRTMSIMAIRFYAVYLIFYSVNYIIMSCFQAMKKLKLANLIYFVDNFAFVTITAAILVHPFGANGVWVAFPVSEVIVFFFIVGCSVIINKKLSFTMEDVLMLPKKNKNNIELRYTIASFDRLIECSREVYDFLDKHGAEKRTSYFLSLFVEEMSGNIVKHGFSDDKKHAIDIRIYQKGEDWILRIRDDCRKFDPIEWSKMNQSNDKYENIGIQMTMKSAKNVRFANSIGMNNLIITI